MGDQYQTRMERRQKKQSSKTFPLMKVMTVFVLTIFLTMAVGGLVVFSYIKDAPELDPKLLKDPLSSTVYDMDNKRVRDISGSEHRKIVKIEDIPKKVQNAFIATEDVRFFEHNGIDFKRIAGAAVANVKEGFGAEGGSTITQQVVKNSFLSPEKTLKRKIQEAYLAIQLEQHYTKEQILEMYLNKVYFGQGAYGVATAAETYFNKSVKELTISEAALLAGLPQRPSGYDPFKHPDLAEKRRNVVLSLMRKHGFITEKEEQKAKAIPVEKMLKKKKEGPKYQAFIDQVIKDIVDAGIPEKDIYTGGLKIYTTLDRDAQKFTEKVLTTDEYIDYPDDQLRAGVVLLDTQTGAVRAIGGSRNTSEKEVQRGFNYATQTRRQPGSTIKPILDYGPGIEHFKWSTFEQFIDEPLTINGKEIKNWDDQYHGSMSMRKALQWSYNIPAVKAFLEVGEDRAKEFAEKLGISLEHVYPSYAIGGFKKGISPLQLAGAYAAFGNEGIYHKPYTVRKIVYPNGKEIKLSSKPVKAMSDYTAYMMTDMLKTVVKEGTGRLANIPGLPLAGKTGTTNLPENIYGEGTSDAWFVGYTTRYTAAVWTGYDQTTQETYLTNEKAKISRYIFKEIMSHVSEKVYTPDFEKPYSVVERVVGGRTELFVRGTPIPVIPKQKEEDKEEDQEQDQKQEEENQEQNEEENQDEMNEDQQENTEDNEEQSEDKKETEQPNQPPANEQPQPPANNGNGQGSGQSPPGGNNQNNGGGGTNNNGTGGSNNSGNGNGLSSNNGPGKGTGTSNPNGKSQSVEQPTDQSSP
jgi:penicillin-binding protein 1A